MTTVVRGPTARVATLRNSVSVALAARQSPHPVSKESPIRTCTHPAIRGISGALALAFAILGVANAEDAVPASVAAADQLPSGQDVSGTVIELAGWIVATNDSQG